MSIKPPPVRYLRPTMTGPNHAEDCDPCNIPCGAEWRVVTRYAYRGIPDDCAWVQWASSSTNARELARHSRLNLRPLETVAYQTILRVESTIAPTEDGLE